MRVREVIPWVLPGVVLIVAGVLSPPGWPSILGYFAAGICFARCLWAVHRTLRLERALRHAQRVRALLECNCGTINGPHEPDCVWWDRWDLRALKARQAKGLE